jgi:putative transposase
MSPLERVNQDETDLDESGAEYLPDARWQRCVVHFYRNVFSHVPAAKVREDRHMLKAIHTQKTSRSLSATPSEPPSPSLRRSCNQGAGLGAAAA